MFKLDRIPSPASAAQGYDSMYLLAAAIKQAKSTDGLKILQALENLQKPVVGVIKIYYKPFSHDNHEAIERIDVVMGEINNGRVVYAYPEDAKKGM
jgi:branched-chain amino acid transport system substrate-binding protein